MFTEFNFCQNIKMSHPLSNDHQKIITTQLLNSSWTLWFSYSCDSQKGTNYGNNLMQVEKVTSWNQFMLLWKCVSNTQNYFINPSDGTYKKYKFGLEQRKIDSINFFKDQIEPRWEFGDNPKYGYFNFGIDKTSEKVNQIFEASIFLGIGEDKQISKDIFGVRIVDLSAKLTHPSRARIQIWVKFRHDNSKQSLQKLLTFQQQLKVYYKETIGEQVTQLKFFNISTSEGEQTKVPKQNNKKNENNSKGNKKYEKNRY